MKTAPNSPHSVRETATKGMFVWKRGTDGMLRAEGIAYIGTRICAAILRCNVVSSDRSKSHENLLLRYRCQWWLAVSGGTQPCFKRISFDLAIAHSRWFTFLSQSW